MLFWNQIIFVKILTNTWATPLVSICCKFITQDKCLLSPILTDNPFECPALIYILTQIVTWKYKSPRYVCVFMRRIKPSDDAFPTAVQHHTPTQVFVASHMYVVCGVLQPESFQVNWLPAKWSIHVCGCWIPSISPRPDLTWSAHTI